MLNLAHPSVPHQTGNQSTNAVFSPQNAWKSYARYATIVTLAALAVSVCSITLANEKVNKDLRVQVQIGTPVPVQRYYRAPAPAPVIVYEQETRGRGYANGHGHARNHHSYHRGHGHHHDHAYQQPAPRYWVPAHQVWRGGVWATVPGFYSASYVHPIPAPIYEPQPRVVYPGWIWVRGHWAWGNVEWSWTPGNWVRM